MKKMSVIFFAILTFAGSTAYSSTFSGLTDFQGMQNSNHDLQLLRQQRFRQEEYNEFKDMKEQKSKHDAEIQADDSLMKRIRNKRPQQNVNFIEENGQIKIKGTDMIN